MAIGRDLDDARLVTDERRSSGRRRIPNPEDPVPDIEPDAPPCRLRVRALNLRMPTACVCCGRGAGRRSIDVVFTQSEVDWGAVVSSAIGIMLLAAAGVGWHSMRFRHGPASETRLSCPACDACRWHETAPPWAWVVALAPIFPVWILSMVYLPLPRNETFLASFAVAFGAFVLVGVVGALLLSQRRAGCIRRRPVRAIARSEGFDVIFGNPAFGARVEEMNPER